MTIKPFGGLCVERLNAVGIVDDPLENQSESPDHQKNQNCKDGEGHNDRDDKCKQFRNSLLKCTLQRPRNGHCKQRERHWSHDRLGIVKRGESNYRRDQQQRDLYDAVVLHGRELRKRRWR